MAQKVRLGIIGIGNMGYGHLTNYLRGALPEIEVTAICDVREDRLERGRAACADPASVGGTVAGYDVKCFSDAAELCRSGAVDAVLVATPHYSHPSLVIDALENGLHVLCEKPAGVYTKQVREMNECADRHPELTFAIDYNQRTNPTYRKIHDIVRSGKYGELRRFNWYITSWFRTQAYYDSGDWRATWAGEGGGVLLNQDPHQLDLWQWITGMPSKIRAVCREGQWHDIEVEDDVVIYAEYANGANGVFVSTTGDCPGNNRLEINLDRARIVSVHGDIHVYELEHPTAQFIKESKEGFAKNDEHEVEVELQGENDQHVGVCNAFAANILRGEPLIADGREGINGLTISNAAFLSSWTGSEIVLPVDEDLFYEKLQGKIAGSRYKKNVREQVSDDMSSTY